MRRKIGINTMLLTLLIGYASTLFLGIAGYFIFGGVLGFWALFVWIGGAIACLVTAYLRLSLKTAEEAENGSALPSRLTTITCAGDKT